jgi:hypothetical protein
MIMVIFFGPRASCALRIMSAMAANVETGLWSLHELVERTQHELASMDVEGHGWRRGRHLCRERYYLCRSFCPAFENKLGLRSRMGLPA